MVSLPRTTTVTALSFLQCCFTLSANVQWNNMSMTRKTGFDSTTSQARTSRAPLIRRRRGGVEVSRSHCDPLSACLGLPCRLRLVARAADEGRQRAGEIHGYRGDCMDIEDLQL